MAIYSSPVSIKDAQAAEEALSLKGEHPALENMKFLYFFLFLWVIFCIFCIFAYVALVVFLRYVWIRTQKAAVASRWVIFAQLDPDPDKPAFFYRIDDFSRKSLNCKQC